MGSVPRFRENDPRFLARFERIGARPSAAAAYVRNTAAVDVRSLLGRISAPTIVGIDSDWQGPQDLTPELAEHILDVRVVEGDNTSFYWGSGILEAAFAFLSGEAATGNRELATILFTDVVNSTRSVAEAGDAQWRQTLDFLDDLVEARAVSVGGRIVKQTGDGHVIEFTRPGDAVKAALRSATTRQPSAYNSAPGIHTGEIERRERRRHRRAQCARRSASRSDRGTRRACHLAYRRRSPRLGRTHPARPRRARTQGHPQPLAALHRYRLTRATPRQNCRSALAEPARGSVGPQNNASLPAVRDTRRRRSGTRCFGALWREWNWLSVAPMFVTGSSAVRLVRDGVYGCGVLAGLLGR